jgi:hypothetical protein
MLRGPRPPPGSAGDLAAVAIMAVPVLRGRAREPRRLGHSATHYTQLRIDPSVPVEMTGRWWPRSAPTRRTRSCQGCCAGGGECLVNASTLEAEGIAAATTGEAMALIVLFGTGLGDTAGRRVFHQYLVIAGIALFLVAGARVVRHVRPGINPDKAGQTSSWLASLARTALTGRTFAVSLGFASDDLLFDLFSLDLVFLALRYRPSFGPLKVAYPAANIASAIPLDPGGLGVIEVTLVTTSVGLGAPRAAAVLAVLGYRIVNYWLPLYPGAIACIRLRLRRAANGKTKPASARQKGSHSIRPGAVHGSQAARWPLFAAR